MTHPVRMKFSLAEQIVMTIHWREPGANVRI